MRKRTLFSAVKFVINFQITAVCVIIKALSETNLVQREAYRAHKWWYNKNPKYGHKYKARFSCYEDMN